MICDKRFTYFTIERLFAIICGKKMVSTADAFMHEQSMTIFIQCTSHGSLLYAMVYLKMPVLYNQISERPVRSESLKV